MNEIILDQFCSIFKPSGIGLVESKLDDDEEEDASSFDNSISPMVNFLVANRNKLMQICLDTFKNLDLEQFDYLLQKIMENDFRTALTTNKRTTVLILEILDANKIKNYYSKNSN